MRASGLIHGESFDAYMKRKGLPMVVAPMPISEYERLLDMKDDKIHELEKELREANRKLGEMG